MTPKDSARVLSRVQSSTVDILTGVSGVDFDGAWSRRMEVAIGNLTIATLGRADFIANEQASGRPKDRLDLELLPPE